MKAKRIGELEKLVSESGAMNNDFFAMCHGPDRVDRAAIVRMSTEWYRVTRAFALSLPGYVYCLAEHIYREGIHQGGIRMDMGIFHLDKRLDTLLAVQGILTDDLGAGRMQGILLPGCEQVHYRMFSQMVDTLVGHGSISRRELWEQRVILDPTEALIKQMRNSLSGLQRAPGVLFCIEQSALSIVQAMRALCLKEGITDKEMPPYITLHVRLEGEHAQSVSSFLEGELLRKDEDEFGEGLFLEDEIGHFCGLLGHFWDVVASGLKMKK